MFSSSSSSSSSSNPTTPRRTSSLTDIEDYGSVEVTERCCGAMVCRVLAPDIFLEAKHGAQEQQEGEDPNFTYVGRPIKNDSELRQVRRAVKACPFHAIRMRRGKKGASVMMEDVEAVYPIPVGTSGDVHLLGFYSSKNASASCYLIVRKGGGGNVLVDCPRPDNEIVQRIKALGGAAYLVFTHKDHTAFHAEWREAFPGLKRVLHAADMVEETNHFFSVNTADVEIKLAGEKMQPLDGEGDVLLIPIPGHTAGSIAVLYRNHFLFTGDSLYWSQPRGHLISSRLHCWQSWRLQAASLGKLAEYKWTHVLPGHGEPYEFGSVEAAHESLAKARAWMAEQPAGHTPFYRFIPWLQLRTYAGMRNLPKWLRWGAEKVLAPVGAPGTVLREKVLNYVKVLFFVWAVTRILPRLLRRPKARLAQCHLPWGHPLLVAEK